MPKVNITSCSERSGRVAPVVDRNRCEGKEECVRVCPFDVLSMRILSPDERAALSLRGRIKSWFHGGKQADVTNPDACHACGLCIAACPEAALTLLPIPT